MDDIEAQRLANVKHKENLLAELNLNSRLTRTSQARTSSLDRGAVVKKRKVKTTTAPSRTSARLRQVERPSYKEEAETNNARDHIDKKLSSRAKAQVVPVVTAAKLEAAPDVDTIRANWAMWKVTGALPRRDRTGTFVFEDFTSFTPNKSPEEMIREGSFGGSYWRPLKSRKLGIIVENDWEELPPTWTEGLDIRKYLTNPKYDADINKYKAACGQSIEEWEASGWIMHEYDVRGWFQWYCRFYQGRRCDDDVRQVSRWRKCVGPTGRWKRMLLKVYLKMGVRDVFDDGEKEDMQEVSPVMHQTCHHWACEIKQQDLDELWQ